jgi:hypothetical protein
MLRAGNTVGNYLRRKGNEAMATLSHLRYVDFSARPALIHPLKISLDPSKSSQ